MSSSSTAPSRASFAAAGFQPRLIPIPAPPNDPLLTDLEIYSMRYQQHGQGSGSTSEPLLLIHGHPQNLSIWHRVAPLLAQRAQRDIVLVDLRGYGHSGVPRVRNFVKQGHEVADAPSTASAAAVERPDEQALRARYSKREMGRDLVWVMKHYGYTRFGVVGHDRGGRVAHRMALDYPEMVTRVMTLDIVPTYDLYARTDKVFATAYWHWFFLIQPYPMPEEMLVHAPKTYLDRMIARFTEQPHEQGKEPIFPPDVLASYLAMLSSPPRVHAMCEDYRCSAPGGLDLELDEQDRKAGNKVRQPLRALWGADNVNQWLFGDHGPIELWQNVCEGKVTGRAYRCGHYMPEEVPDDMAEEILTFFS